MASREAGKRRLLGRLVTATAAAPQAAYAARSHRRLLTSWLHLTVLWSFAFVQPLFNVLEDSPEFFVARGNTRADILLFAFGLTLIPPTILTVIEALFIGVEKVRRVIHIAFVAALAAAIALQALKSLVGGSSSTLIPAAVALGAACGFAYSRTRFVPSVLSVLSPAPVFFLAFFLVFSDVSKLVLPQGETRNLYAKVPSNTPVVFVIFDEFSVASLMDERHQIDATRYPNFGKLAGDATWYRSATTVADDTPEAVPAILTGRKPRDGLLPIASDQPRNLFTLLGQDYAFNATESVTQLCPERLCKGRDDSSLGSLDSLVSDLTVVSLHLLLPENLEEGLPSVDRTFGDFGGTSRNTVSPSAGVRLVGGIPFIHKTGTPSELYMRFVRRIKPHSGRPRLDLMHVPLPHWPWEFLPSGQHYAVAREPDILGAGRKPWARTPGPASEGFRRYLLQVGYVDRLLGRLLARLRSTGLYDKSLLIVTADHGVAFRPGQHRRLVGKETFADIAGIPLFVKPPGQRAGRISDAQVRTIDILPTVADYLGVRVPWAEGHSFRDRTQIPTGRIAVRSSVGGQVVQGFSAFRTGLYRLTDRLTRISRADRHLVGVSPGQLPAAPHEDAEVKLDRPESYRSVDPAGPEVPTFVTGTISNGIADGQRIAVAVNGRIRAVTYTYAQAGDMCFGTMVPVSAFRRGANEIEVYEVQKAAGRERLAAIRSGERRLVRRGGRQVVTSPSGRDIEVVPSAVNGFVDGLESSGAELTVSGWAGSSVRHRVADRVFLVVDGSVVAQGTTGILRPDVAKARGRALRRSGFKIVYPTEDAGNLAKSRSVKVLAVLGDRATELER